MDVVLDALDAIPAEVYRASGMVRVGPESRVAGPAFVPVGRGYAPGVAFPVGGVMVLGQDFGNEHDLAAVVAQGEETDEFRRGARWARPSATPVSRAMRAGVPTT